MPREWALDCIDESRHRGLEIGPLATPIASKAHGEVFYVDHLDAEGLRRKYADDAHMRSRLDQIVDVDFVLPEGQSVFEALASQGPFDYVIASHVIEHVPDVVTWLEGIRRLLVPAGILSLVIPDKRFTFDVNRAPTDISAILDAHHRKASQPSFGQIYDFCSKTIHGVDPHRIWSGEADYGAVVRTDCPDPEAMGFEFAEKALLSGEFIDIHCHVFTPSSLLEIIEELSHLGLLPFEVASFHPTARDDLEFFLSLRALTSSDQSPSESIRQRQAMAVEAAKLVLKHADEPAGGAHHDEVQPPPDVVELSTLERRVIGVKRKVMGRIRRTRG